MLCLIKKPPHRWNINSNRTEHLFVCLLVCVCVCVCEREREREREREKEKEREMMH